MQPLDAIHEQIYTLQSRRLIPELIMIGPRHHNGLVAQMRAYPDLFTLDGKGYQIAGLPVYSDYFDPDRLSVIPRPRHWGVHRLEAAPTTRYLVIDNHAFPLSLPSDAKRPDYRREEDLLFARIALDDLSLHPPYSHFQETYGLALPADWTAFLLTPVADCYGVDRDELWTTVTRHRHDWVRLLDRIESDTTRPFDTR